MVLNSAHQCDSRTNTNVLEVFQELESDALVLGHGMSVFVLTALHREKPVEVVGQLCAAASSKEEEARQVGKLRNKVMEGGGGGGGREVTENFGL